MKEYIKHHISHKELQTILIDYFKKKHNIDDYQNIGEYYHIRVDFYKDIFAAEIICNIRFGNYKSNIKEFLDLEDIKEIISNSLQYEDYSISEIDLCSKYCKVINSSFPTAKYQDVYSFKGANITLKSQGKKRALKLINKKD